jgi:hypothetical protein
MKGGDYFEDRDVEWGIILKCILKKWEVESVHLTPDRVQWRVLLNTVMNLRAQ